MSVAPSDTPSLDSLEESPTRRPTWPKGKISQKHFDALYRFECRQMAINLLREKYQLSYHECQGVSPSVVQERQRLYSEHLGRLREIWDQEDLALEEV